MAKRSGSVALAALVSLGGGAALLQPARAVTPARAIEGTIVRFECGDNCYLIIRDKARVEHTGLCAAPLCREWNENTEMPRRFVGRRVRVTIGRGTQVNGSGETMGDFPAFATIVLLE